MKTRIYNAMKTRIYNFIEYVIDEMPYYKVFILFTVLIQPITIPSIMFLFGEGIIKDLIFSIFLSMLFSTYFLLIIYEMRRVTIFWNAVHNFQADLNEVKTKQDVLSLKSKYNKLRELSTGLKTHSGKLDELRAVMTVKFELLPDSNTNSVTNQ